MRSAILIVSSEFPPGPGGIGDHAFNLADQLTKVGYKVTVVSEWRRQFGSTEVGIDPRVNLRLVRSDSAFRNFLFVLKYLYAVLSSRKKIVIATGSKSIRLVGTVQYFSSIQKVAILHGHEVLMGGTLGRWLLRRVLTRFQLGISVSEFSRINTSQYVGIEKLIVIPNGLNERKFIEGSSSSEPKALNVSLALITVGRVSKRKGQRNVVMAMPKLIERFSNLSYHIVGLVDDGGDCQGIVDALGLTTNVRFYGMVSNESLESIIRSSDIFIMLSENQPNGDVEGFGIAILEANWFGVPAIGSYGCGIEQAIDNGVNGLLINPKNPDELVNAVEEIVSSYSRYSKASSYWSQKHKWSSIVKYYDDALCNL